MTTELMEHVPEVLERTGVTYRQLDYWSRQGYLHPDKEANGSGTRRGWSEAELRVAALMKRLIDAGLTLRPAARIARDLAYYPRNVCITCGQDSEQTIPIGPGINISVWGAL